METFIVRVWRPSPELAHEIFSGELRGSVEHLGSKQQVQFRSSTDLVTFLISALEVEGETQPATRFKPT